MACLRLNPADGSMGFLRGGQELRRAEEASALLTDIHHVSVPANDPLASSDWYVRVFDFVSVLIEEQESDVVSVLLEHPYGAQLLLWRDDAGGRIARIPVVRPDCREPRRAAALG